MGGVFFYFRWNPKEQQLHFIIISKEKNHPYQAIKNIFLIQI